MDIGDINIDDLTMDIDQIIEHASSIIPTFVAIDDCIKVNFETDLVGDGLVLTQSMKDMT